MTDREKLIESALLQGCKLTKDNDECEGAGPFCVECEFARALHILRHPETFKDGDVREWGKPEVSNGQ